MSLSLFGDDLFGDPNSAELTPGSSVVLSGQSKRWTLVVDRPIAEGGFGGVFLVRDDRGATHALKRIRYKTAEIRDRSIFEASLMVSLPPHDNIVRCWDYENRPYKTKNATYKR
jgi:hypothetical protein